MYVDELIHSFCCVLEHRRAELRAQFIREMQWVPIDDYTAITVVCVTV